MVETTQQQRNDIYPAAGLHVQQQKKCPFAVSRCGIDINTKSFIHSSHVYMSQHVGGPPSIRPMLIIIIIIQSDIFQVSLYIPYIAKNVYDALIEIFSFI